MSNYSQFIGGGTGSSGVSGYSGRSGYSGSTGTSGFSGFSGQTGSTTLTNTYIGFGNASNQITGSANLTWNGSALTVGSTTATIIGNVGEYNTFTIQPNDATSGNYPAVITIKGGRSNASSAPGGALNIQGGPGPSSLSGAGGPVNITGGASSVAVNGGDGGDVNITGGTGAAQASRVGGSIVLTGGIGVGTGGAIVFRTPNPSVVAERARFTPAGALSFGSTGTAYGTAGQVLTSNGDAPPSWQTASGGSSGVSGYSGTSGYSGAASQINISNSVFLDGNGDYLTVANSSNFDFGTGAFTVEGWTYIAANSTANPDGNRYASIVNAFFDSTASTGWRLAIIGNTTTTGTGLQFNVFNAGVSTDIVTTATTVTQNAWHHVAVSRTGNTFYLFLDGVQVATNTFSGNVNSGGFDLDIGSLQQGVAPKYYNYLNGYVSNIRIVKGSAVYTGAFTPPTSPLTSIAGTVLLVCQSNVFAGITTVAGNSAISTENPFGNANYSGYSGLSGYSGIGISGFSGYSGVTPDLSSYVTLTGTQTLTNKTYTGVKETRVAMAANDVDLSLGNYYTKTATTTTTFTASNVPASGTTGSFILELTNGGSQTINWFTGTTWASGVAPTLTAAGVDVLGFYTFDGGTTWRGLTLALDIK